jgi:hypothetical protein
MRWIPIPEILILGGASSLIWAIGEAAFGFAARTYLIEGFVGVVCLAGGLALRWRAPWG